MKYLASLPPLVAAFCLAAPVTGLSRDHHDDHRHSDHHDWDHGHWDHHRSGPSVSFYRPYPSYYRSYPYSYGSYPYSYRSYPYSYGSYPYYGSSFGLTLSTRPTYYNESTYYRGVTRDSSDELAVDVQRALARRGYYHGAIDGGIGSGTRAAIRRYQYDRGLEVTGRIDRSLLRSLGLS